MLPSFLFSFKPLPHLHCEINSIFSFINIITYICICTETYLCKPLDVCFFLYLPQGNALSRRLTYSVHCFCIKVTRTWFLVPCLVFAHLVVCTYNPRTPMGSIKQVMMSWHPRCVLALISKCLLTTIVP